MSAEYLREVLGLSDSSLIKLYESIRMNRHYPERTTVVSELERRAQNGPVHCGSIIYVWDRIEKSVVRRILSARAPASNHNRVSGLGRQAELASMTRGERRAAHIREAEDNRLA